MLHVVKVKGCKRCGGDLFLERDSEGAYVSCLQCGAVYVRHDKEKVKEIKEVPTR
jgi:DNA-directed RNA polymerase subunit RPC12/RpoP